LFLPATRPGFTKQDDEGAIVFKTSKAAIAATAAVAALTLLTACGGSSSAGAGSKDAVIGLAMPVSGPDAPLAEPMINAVKLAIDQANASGDLPGKLTLDVQDDQSSPSVGASLARKFCGNTETVAAIADYASSITLNAQPVYNGCGMTQIVPTASNDTLTTKGFKNFFRVTAKNSDATVGSVKWITANRPNVKSVATIDANDASTADIATQFADQSKKAGLNVVDSIHITANQGDFRGALTGLLSKKPDLIYVAAFYNDGGLITKQARELGFKGELFGSDASDSPDFITIAGADAAEGFHLASLGLDPTKTPSASGFVEAYTKAYNSAPNSAASQSYDTAQVLINAWKSIGGGTDRTALIDAVTKTQLTGVGGAIEFDENGDMKKPQVGITEVKSGKWQFVGPAE
jgi:branched-chain amino acid transport system substrate-binding protein